MSNRKLNKSPKPPQRNTALGIAANIALGPLGFRAELGLGGDQDRSLRDLQTDWPDLNVTLDEAPGPSRISFHGQRGVNPGLSSQERAPTPVLIVGHDTKDKNELTGRCFWSFSCRSMFMSCICPRQESISTTQERKKTNQQL